ncbi:MAG: invasin domain 3-containing protein [bacterium]|nr:invasin domain 3-containing protein [bacterium]
MIKNKNLIIVSLVCFLVSIFLVFGCKKKESILSVTKDIFITITSEKDSLLADGTSTSIITALVRLESDTTCVSGTVVSFKTSLGSITSSDTTGSDGVATATLTSLATTGLARITVTAEGTSKVAQLKFYSTSGNTTIYISSITASPQTISVGGENNSTITAFLKYTNNNPAVNIPVFFTTTMGTISPFSDTTDSSGKVTTNLVSGDSTGIATVKVTYGSITDSTNVLFTTTLGDTTPASIVFYAIDNSSIGVQGTGQNETSMLTFQVRDKEGKPISGTKNVTFEIIGGPNGGEYLYPTSSVTSMDLALVSTYLNSGTKSGPVRIKALVQGTSLTTSIEKVVILSGPPDSSHFNIYPVKLNTYALYIAGVSNIITAYVADKHGNTVENNTGVWFNTQCGLVQTGMGSTVTGLTSNTLLTCAPWPNTTNGFFYVFGETKDGNGNTLKDSTRLLWTGPTILELTPLTFNISNGGSQTFAISVHDFNGNPLSGVTTISTSTNAGELRGQTSITILDTQDPYWTNFSVTLMDDKPDTVEARNCKLSVTVTSPNGNESKNAYGVIW